MYAADTIVPVAKSRAEIEAILQRHKAKQFGTAVDYDKLQARVQFRLQDREIRFVIALPNPKQTGGVAKYERAERQRWRALLLVLKAKLESVESGIETFERAFLSQIVMPNGETVGDLVLPQIAESYETGRMPRAALGPAEEYIDAER